MENELKEGEPWCSCPQCAHLRSGEKPWKNPTCSVCNTTGKVAASRMCSKGHGAIAETCFWCKGEVSDAN